MVFIKKYFFFILLCSLSIIYGILHAINENKKNGNKVYVIGIVTNKEPYKSGGVIYNYDYYFRGNKFTGQNTDNFWDKKVNDLFYIKLYLYLHDSTKIADLDFIDSVSVPSCLTIRNIPFIGWQELPRDSCRINE